jgi:hypothetical protein
MSNAKHVVLTGDSIFDNAPYVKNNQAVINHLRGIAGEEFKSTLLAIDGSVTDEVHQQLDVLPADTTHLFISSGGNDALEAAMVLHAPVATVHEAMGEFLPILNRFQESYSNLLSEAAGRVENLVVCTIYDSIPGMDGETLTALKLFNEIILREAFALNLPVMDLRLLCDEASDYSVISPIEPSETGGEKIAVNIMNIVRNYDFSNKQSVIFS